MTDETSFTPSELLHAFAIGILKEDLGKGDDYSAADYAEALERARLCYGDVYQEAEPSAAQAERTQIERQMAARASS
jgi:hypothetical protein